uniref:ANF_receptor domain-containing protein n=1 Tax=Macrostomum lignano TaxID=282301 RepID=A0A1I8HBR0_9PLAT
MAALKQPLPYRLLCLLPNQSNYQFDMRYILPSQSLINAELTKRGLADQFSINISFEASTCSNLAAVPAMQYYYSGWVDGFVGLPCPESCSQVVQYSNAIWNKPVVSIGSVESTFRDPEKIKYRNKIFARVSFDSGELMRSILKRIFITNNWSRFFGLYSWNYGYTKDGCSLLMMDLNKEWQAMGKKAEFMDTYGGRFSDQDLHTAFTEKIGTDYSGKRNRFRKAPICIEMRFCGAEIFYLDMFLSGSIF